MLWPASADFLFLSQLPMKKRMKKLKREASKESPLDGGNLTPSGACKTSPTGSSTPLPLFMLSPSGIS